MQQSQKNLRGIVAVLIAMFMFVANDALMKLARASLDSGQAMFLRGCFAIVFLFGAIGVRKAWADVPMVLSRFAISRGALEGMIAALFITALSVMALADITAILMLAPLMITALSTLFFGEKVGWRRWSAVLVGFAGILLVIRPEGASAPWLAIAMAFGSVLGVAIRDVTTRRAPANVPSMILTLASLCGTLVAGLLMALGWQGFRPVEPIVLMALAGAAVFVLIGNVAIVEAHRDVDLSVVSPFRYSVIFWAVLLGYLFFGEVPSWLSVLGLGMVLASGLYTIHRERERRREEVREATGKLD